METTRAFIAIPIEAAATSTLRSLIKRLGAELNHVRWTEPDQLHITLQFIGDIDNRRLHDLCELTRAAAEEFHATQLALSGLGTFPKGKPAKVIWVGLNDEAQELAKWHAVLESRLSEFDLPSDGKAFNPHLTIGRVSKAAEPEQIAQAIAAGDSCFPIRLEVDELHVLSSRRERGKTAYERIATIGLF